MLISYQVNASKNYLLDILKFYFQINKTMKYSDQDFSCVWLIEKLGWIRYMIDHKREDCVLYIVNTIVPFYTFENLCTS